MVTRGAGVVLLCVFAWASNAPPAAAQMNSQQLERLEALERKMKALDPSFEPAASGTIEARLEALEARMERLLAERRVVPEPAQAPSQALQTVSVSGDFQAAADTENRLPVAGYMDFHVNKDAGDAFRPDFHRFVLLFGHSFSERIKFWSELEVEHALIEGGEESGEVALEQAYIDVLIKPWFNLRGGMLLAPVGIINERHEPPSFNGVERPFVESIIIPTTWRELGFGFTGDLGRGFRYRTYLTSALDASRFDAESGIGSGKTSGFDASMRNPALIGRLEYSGVRRLTLGTSFYTGLAGFHTPGLNPRVTIAEADGRYSFHRFDFRALFANTWVSRAGELNFRIRQQRGVNPNIARQMRGYYFEPAVHVLPRSLRSDLALFARYEKFNTQQVMPAGYAPLKQFDRHAWVTGVTFRPVPDVAFKFDYVFHGNASTVVRPVDSVNLGIGWWF
jgi:hypothetical protein